MSPKDFAGLDNAGVAAVGLRALALWLALKWCERFPGRSVEDAYATVFDFLGGKRDPKK